MGKKYIHRPLAPVAKLPQSPVFEVEKEEPDTIYAVRMTATAQNSGKPNLAPYRDDAVTSKMTIAFWVMLSAVEG